MFNITADEMNKLSQENFDRNYADLHTQLSQALKDVAILGQFKANFDVPKVYLDMIVDHLIDLDYTVTKICYEPSMVKIRIEW